MEIVEIIKEVTKFSEGANKELSYIFIIPTIIMIIAAIRIINTYRRKTKQNSTYKYILTHHLALGCSLLIISAISGITTCLMIFQPTSFDDILSDTKTTYNKNVDPNKYELIVSNNKENLEFDNKGDKNIILTYNDRKIDNKIFKIIDQTDTHYIVEVQIIDYGLFTDTVRTEKVSLPKK
jgi:hypothetical protein